MEQAIMMLGQAALLVASVVAVLGMVYVACWLLVGIVRLAKRLQSVGGRASTPARYRVGGGLRKW